MDELIQRVSHCLGRSAAAWRKTREKALESYRMVAGEEHYEGASAEERRLAGRPALVVNKLPKFVQQVVGEFRLANYGIRVSPSDDRADVKTAEVLNGLLRSIQTDSTARVARRTALSQAVVGGVGYYRVARDYEAWDAWDQVLKVQPIPNAFGVYVDAASYRMDLSDAWHVGIIEEMSTADLKRRYPKADLADMPQQDVEGWAWLGVDKGTTRVCEWWERVPERVRLLLVGTDEADPNARVVRWPKGEEEQQRLIDEMIAAGVGVLRERETDAWRIESSLLCGGGVLSPPERWPGRYFPIIQVVGEELVFDGERHLWGVVEGPKDTQRLYNLEVSAAAEIVSLSPKSPYLLTPKQLGAHGAFWGAANRTTLPFLLYDPDPNAARPTREPGPQIPSANLALMDRCDRDFLDTTGQYAAALGDQSAEKSGVAIRERRMGSNVTTSAYTDNMSLAMEHECRVLLDLIPYVYDAERTVRITGEDLVTVESARINGPGGPDVTQGRYDVAVDVGPAFQTRRQEAQDFLLEASKLLGPAALGILDLVFSYSDAPGKSELVERIKQMQGGAQAAPMGPAGMDAGLPPDMGPGMEGQGSPVTGPFGAQAPPMPYPPPM